MVSAALASILRSGRTDFNARFAAARRIYPELQSEAFAEFLRTAVDELVGAVEKVRADRVGWLRKVFDLSGADYDRLNLDRDDPVAELATEFRRGLEGLSESETRSRLVRIERLITEWSKGRKLYGHLYEDLLKLKYLHQRYTNYLRWLKTQ